MPLTRDQTKRLQGLAVFMMVNLHLFCRLDEGVFTPLIRLFGVPLTYYWGVFCDSCVCLFAMCSGYGIAQKIKMGKSQKSNLTGLGRTLIYYETVLFLFAAVCLISGQGAWLTDGKTFLLHVIPLLHDYNGAWWYVLTYSLLILSIPLIRKVYEKSPAVTLLISAALFFVTHFFKERSIFSGAIAGFAFHQAVMYFNTLFPFLIGFFLARSALMEKIASFFQRIKKPYLYLLSSLAVLACAVVHAVVVSSIVAPAMALLLFVLFSLIFENLRPIRTVFDFLGDHSVGIWLCHMFFWQDRYGALVYKAKYAVLILLLILFLSILSSYILKLASRPALALYRKKTMKRS